MIILRMKSLAVYSSSKTTEIAMDMDQIFSKEVFTMH